MFLKTSLSYPQQEDHEIDTLLGMKSLLTQKKYINKPMLKMANILF